MIDEEKYVLGNYNHGLAVLIFVATPSYLEGWYDTKKLELNEIDNGKTFEIDRGGLILIRLAESPTTGYRWKVNAVDDQRITLHDSKFNPGTGIGGGGVSTFAFKAESPGKTVIRLQLERPWEKGISRNRFEVSLNVE